LFEWERSAMGKGTYGCNSIVRWRGHKHTFAYVSISTKHGL